MQLFIPRPLLVTVDDTGWWLGQDGSADNQPFRTGMPRKHVPEDYEALIALGKGVNMKIPAGFVLGEWDETGILRDVPSATWMGENWKSPFSGREIKEKTAEIIRQGEPYLEVALHGLCHEFWEDGKINRSEFHDSQGYMRSESLVRKHLEYFFKLLEEFRLAKEPRLFIPPALNHCFGDGKTGFQAIASSFGIQYVTLVFSRARCSSKPQFDRLGWEEDIILLDRGITGIQWSQVAQKPTCNFASPILPLHWANILHPDPTRNMDVIQAWLSFLQTGAREKNLVLSRDIASCISQYLNASQSRIAIEHNRIIVSLDWLDTVPRQHLADELFFAVTPRENGDFLIHGAERKAPSSPHEAQFVKLALPKENRIIFEFQKHA